MGIALQGVPVDTVTTGVDQFVTRTYQVVISGGQLDLGLTNQSTNNLGVAVIDALTISQVS
jgi:broad specificity polyphosphatase/5'/3'-nucleotidase SurE